MLRVLFGLVLALSLLPVGAAQAGYKILQGDVLSFEVLEDPTMNRDLLVLPDGTVSVPLVGNVQAAGQSVEALKSALTSMLAPKFAAPPTLFMSVKTLNPMTTAINNARAQEAAQNGMNGQTISIFANGEFNKIGKVMIRPGTTILQFLGESGGLTKYAALKRIQLHRVDSKSGRETVYNYNYKAVMKGEGAPVIYLQEGDVIVAPQRRLFE